jgi:hypothetical protein
MQNVSAIDPMGPLLIHLAHKLQRQPLGQPGLFRKICMETACDLLK